MMTTSLNSDVAVSSVERLGELAEAMNDLTRAIRLSVVKSAALTLTPTQATVMRAIRTEPGSTATRVAEICALQLTNVSSTVRELRALGFISARRGDVDARQVLLEATPLADETLASIHTARAEHLRGLWERANAGTDEELELVTAVLTRMRDGLRAERATNVVTSASPASAHTDAQS